MRHFPRVRQEAATRWCAMMGVESGKSGYFLSSDSAILRMDFMFIVTI